MLPLIMSHSGLHACDDDFMPAVRFPILACQAGTSAGAPQRFRQLRDAEEAQPHSKAVVSGTRPGQLRAAHREVYQAHEDVIDLNSTGAQTQSAGRLPGAPSMGTGTKDNHPSLQGNATPTKLVPVMSCRAGASTDIL